MNQLHYITLQKSSNLNSDYSLEPGIIGRFPLTSRAELTKEMTTWNNISWHEYKIRDREYF
jgi:hypothetical protein